MGIIRALCNHIQPSPWLRTMGCAALGPHGYKWAVIKSDTWQFQFLFHIKLFQFCKSKKSGADFVFHLDRHRGGYSAWFALLHKGIGWDSVWMIEPLTQCFQSVLTHYTVDDQQCDWSELITNRVNITSRKRHLWPPPYWLQVREPCARSFMRPNGPYFLYSFFDCCLLSFCPQSEMHTNLTN